MTELSQLIQINKNIEKQNEEIIRLLKIIANQKEEVSLIEENDTLKIGSLVVGEVYFIEDSDIFKLSIKNNETSIDNLTGNSQAIMFTLEELIANESIKNNKSLDDGTVILSSEHSKNLPETLKICVEQGAKKIYMHLSVSPQLVGAPQSLMELIKFDFYKNNEDLMEKLFK